MQTFICAREHHVQQLQAFRCVCSHVRPSLVTWLRHADWFANQANIFLQVDRWQSFSILLYHWQFARRRPSMMLAVLLIRYLWKSITHWTSRDTLWLSAVGFFTQLRRHIDGEVDYWWPNIVSGMGCAPAKDGHYVHGYGSGVLLYSPHSHWSRG